MVGWGETAVLVRGVLLWLGSAGADISAGGGGYGVLALVLVMEESFVMCLLHFRIFCRFEDVTPLSQNLYLLSALTSPFRLNKYNHKATKSHHPCTKP